MALEQQTEEKQQLSMGTSKASYCIGYVTTSAVITILPC
jgi:hypothetical protein